MSPLNKEIRKEVAATRLLIAKKGLESHGTFKSLFHSSPLALTALDRDFNIILWSPAAERLFGWDASKIEGYPFPVAPEDTEAALHKLWTKVFDGESFSGIEARIEKNDGTLMTVSISCAPLYDGKQRVTGIMVIFEDITERKLALEALQTSEVRYRTLVERMNEGLLFVDNDDKIQFVNKQFLRLLGYSREEIAGKTAGELFFKEADKEVLRKRNQRLKASIASKDELQMLTKSKKLIWVDVRSIPVYEASGKVVGSTGIYTDITERKETVEKLQNSHNQLHILSMKLKAEHAQNITDISKVIKKEFIPVLRVLKKELESLKNNLPPRQSVLTKKTVSAVRRIDKLIKAALKISGSEKKR